MDLQRQSRAKADVKAFIGCIYDSSFPSNCTDSTNICDLEPIEQKNRMQIYVLLHETCQLQKSCHVIEATINHVSARGHKLATRVFLRVYLGIKFVGSCTNMISGSFYSMT